jgi:O-antigen/teichoic acid export membrane protein
MIAGTVLIASNKEGPRTKLAVAAAIINPLVNLAAIPYFQEFHANGAIGAAIVSVIIEVFMMAGMLRLLDPGIFVRSNVTTALRCLAAAVPMALAMIAVAPFGLLPILLAGAVVYLPAAIAFRAITAREVIDLPRSVLSRGRAVEVQAVA